MSHFTVLVIGDNIDKQLTPFQENNMGDCPREYMEFNDVMEKYKDEYETETEKKIEVNGEYHCPYDSMFKVEITEEEYKQAREDKKQGYGSSSSNNVMTYYKYDRSIGKEVEVPNTELYESLEAYVIDRGYEKDEETGKYGYWENPNAKWDWYQLGGRWAGALKLKDDVEMEQAPNFSWGWDKEAALEVIKEKRVDQAKKGDINWEAINNAKEDYDKAIRFWEMKVEGAEPETDKEKDSLKWDWYKEGYYQEKYGDKETYAKCQSSFTTYAVVKDGKWYGKGDMGWFGMSSESHDEAINWELNFFDAFIKDLSDDTVISVVDCHI